MPPREKKKVKDSEEDVDHDSGLKQFMKTYEADHYNSNDNYFDYKVSTGSLKLDKETEGGLGPGIHRFMGITEGGKTSECLEILTNFLDTVENSRCVYIKAEGRLSEKMKKRVGRPFVTDIADWKAGTIFVLKSNVYDMIINFVHNLVHDNPLDYRYCIVIDSMDALNLRADIEKAAANASKKPGAKQEEERVAGAPLLTKRFLTKMSLPICELGHMVLMISQVSTEIKISQYGGGPSRKVSGTGGNAAMHFANWIFDYLGRSRGDLICKSSDAALAPDSVKNPILGHWAKVVVRKSENEKSEYLFKYPIKYGAVGRSSIWRSMEVVDKMMEWELISKGGSWLTFHETAIERSKKAGIELPVKVQGLAAAYEIFDKNQALSDLWYKYFVDNDVAETITDNINPELFEDED
jgi:hypothetical protein